METSWRSGGSEKARSSPAGCRQRRDYPPGYTVFECRLDGNQPIAQVVQVPSDTVGSMQNKTCMLLETRQSESGPSSRVVAYPAGGTSCKRRPATEPMSFALEARDCPGGPVARAEKVAEHVAESSAMCSKPITILETTKGPKCPSGPSSRLLYGPVSQEPGKSTGSYEPPGFYIQCTTTPEGPIARVTQVPRGLSSGDPGTSFEAFVKRDGSSPTAVVTRCNREEVGQKACGYLETRVDASGPRAKALAFPEGPSDFRHFTNLDVRQQEDGPFARISQHPGHPREFISSLPSEQPNYRCLNKCAAKPVSNVRRRNGMSPMNSDQPGGSGPSKNIRMRKGRHGEALKTCPGHCCRPASSPDPTSQVCVTQPPPCASNTLPMATKRRTSTYPRPATCFCPLEQQCKVPDHPFSALRPLPGGSVVPRCPPPSLPEIAPVPTGVNRLRDYKPRPKAKGPRNPTKASPLRSRKPPRVEIKFKKPVKPAAKKKTKNKKTGRSGKHRKPPKKADDDNVGDEELTSMPQETYVECPGAAPKGIESLDACENPSCPECPAFASKEIDSVGAEGNSPHVECPAIASKGVQSDGAFEKSPRVECPAFASKGVQSVRACEKSPRVECPAFASKGVQSVRVSQEPTCVKCPAVASKGNQSIRDRDEPSYMECPAFASKGNQSVYVCKEPSYVVCPAFASKGNQSIHICKEPSYVECPAFTSNANQSIRDEPSYVKCPAFASGGNQSSLVAEEARYVRHPARNKLVPRFEEPEYVKCPAFASKKSSETSSAYVPREDVLVSQYSEHFRPMTLETPVGCCAKRNRLRDECRPRIPQTVLRMSYEQRRNRHARTLLSNGTRHSGFDDDESCSKNRKQDGHSKKGKEENVEDTEKLEEPMPPGSKRKIRLKRAKSRELRAGVVYYDCDCYHRNGLQQDCPRGGCGGLKHCLTRPWPNCDLSGYFRKKWGKYNSILDLIPPSTYCGPRDALFRAKMAEKNCLRAQDQDEKLEKTQEDLTKTGGNQTKGNEKKTDKKPKERRLYRKSSDECQKVHDNMVQKYAMIPVAVDQHCPAT